MKKITVEMYIGFSTGGDTGHWLTDYVEIPANTPKHLLEKKAVKKMYSKLKKENSGHGVAFVGVYHINAPEED